MIFNGVISLVHFKGSGVPDMLREVEVKVLHSNICAKMLSGYPWDRKTDTMLCAGGEDKVT